MKNFQTILITAILFAFTAFAACSSDKNQPDTTTIETDTTTAGVTPPAPQGSNVSSDQSAAPAAEDAEAIAAFLKKQKQDYKGLLQGKWQSASDASMQVEFAGNKIRYSKGGKLTRETELEIDIKCTSSVCKYGSAPFGWCFTEKGPNGNQCNLVMSCDQVQMLYRVGGAPEELVLNRIKD